MISKTDQVHPVKQDQETQSIKQNEQTFDYLCDMRSIIGSTLASSY